MDQLSDVLIVISHPTRRGIIGRLANGPARFLDVAKSFDTALNAVNKHLLELSLILVVGVCGVPRTSAAAGTDDTRLITVRIHNYAQVESSVLVKAERTTDDIFHEAGLQVVWLDCWTRQIPAKEPVCQIPIGPTDLILNLLPQSMSRRSHVTVGALGVALEDSETGSGFEAWIFCDLVKDTAIHGQLTQSVLLGTVIAHELGHLLLSTNSHSAFGPMRANWSSKELWAVEHRAIYFSSSESERIRQAVIARRQSRERQVTAP
jgi:hypothetical protein